MLPSGELIGMFHMIGQATLKQYGCLTCASYTIVLINHLQSLTDLWGNIYTFLLLHRFLKIDFAKYSLPGNQLSQFKLNICSAS